MPAVTVENPLTLPRVTAPEGAAARPVLAVTTAPQGFEGEGFPVRRAFAGINYKHLDPFIMMDQMGEVEYAPGEPKGTPWHPHRGFETVTYLLDGTFVHQDSNGGGGTITDGDTQWMTAGSGLLHIEAPPESLVMSGGLFHGLQLWVNLPAADKMMAPRYQDIRGGQVQLLTSAGRGALLRLIAGLARRARGAGHHAHPDHDGARDAAAGCVRHAAVAGGLQRARLRAGRARVGRRRAAARPHGADGRVRRRRFADGPRGREAGRATPPTWRSCCSAGAPSVSRWRTTGRS